MNKLVFVFTLLFSVALFAGDPIPGIDITVNQSPGGIVGSGQTGEDGTVVFTELKPGPCTLTFLHEGKEIVLGGKPKERIVIPGNSKGVMKPLLFELSPESNKATLSKKRADRPEPNGATNRESSKSKVAKESDGGAKKAGAAVAKTKAAQSGKKASSSSNDPVNTDLDDDGDGLPTRSADGIADCAQLIEITPLGKGQLQVKVTCQ